MGDERPAVQADLPRARGPQHVVVGGVSSVLVAFAVLWMVVPYDMIAHDEGQYGQSAVRILAGELPHRDFHEMYSGGLSYWHALLFWLFGEQLIVLRRALVVLAMPAVLSAYAIALRFTASSVLAGIVAVAGIIGSVGTLHTVWANLYLGFLSMIIAWLLTRYADDVHPKWIMLIGVLCGVAIAIKITGLYTLAAVGLAITFCGTDLPASPGWLERFYRGAVAAAAIAAGPLLVAAHPTVDAIAYFAVPTAAMGVALVMAGRRFDDRLMVRRHAILGASVAVTLLIFMTPWIAGEAVGDLIEGLVIRPKMRLASTAYYPPPEAIYALLAVPLVTCCLLCRQSPPLRRLAWACTGLVIALFGIGLTARQPSGFVAPAMMAALEGWRWFPALGCPAMAWLLVRDSPQQGGQPVAGFAVAAMTACFALNQYPFASPVYFFFVWPFVALMVVALTYAAAGDRSAEDSTVAGQSSPLLPAVAVVGSFVVFCLIRFGWQGVFVETRVGPPMAECAPISGLLEDRTVAEQYERLAALLDATLRPGQTVLAGPDSPDVYFFTGRRNPTPVMYEMFAAPERHAATLRRLAESDEIGAVIFNMFPGFSEPWSEDVGRPLVQRMRQQTRIGKFIVYFDRITE